MPHLQASRDGLEYFWIDTCCINKADKAEEKLSIRSMFQWYRDAARCYVYLSDVTTKKRKVNNVVGELCWKAAFKSSLWFTRGWTLQELLAPSSVEFFSRDGEMLGDRLSLKEEVHEVTRIPRSALKDAVLFEFSVNERMTWTEHRKTKLPVDLAYSLMGILGVSMTPIDNESQSEAFRRLMDEFDKQSKCIQDLRLTNPRHDKARIEETKGGLLENAYCWVLENASFRQWRNEANSHLLWVKGDPGKGKTMLLCGIINELQKSAGNTVTVSYFFCQATDSRINSATAVLRGLLYMLVDQQPSLVSHIRKKYDRAGKSLFEDANAWTALSDILADVLNDPSLGTGYLIIDALDECVFDVPKLLKFVIEHLSASSRVKWIVSSRNWPKIEERLEMAGHKVMLSLELNAESLSKAVSVFIQRKVTQLAQQKNYDERTRDAVLEHLFSNANNTFLWVALVCQNLEGASIRNVLKKLSSFPPGLDSLYNWMMQRISNLEDDTELCKRVLAMIALVYRPITLVELASLVGQPGDVPEDKESIKEVSAQDFLLNGATKECFPSGTKDVHYSLFARSLQLLSATLHRDIYGVKELGYHIEDAETPEPDPLATSRYSCVYWIDHLRDAHSSSSVIDAADLQAGGIVDTFLRKRYLYWLEALSLCKSLLRGVVSIAELQSIVQKKGNATQLIELIQDAQQFVMYHKGTIESYPLQT
ncbi:NACHT-domain-containing protein [Clathrospora elynae]|uniref:NACHT-domain-containing protein n=1 Tax=Clathrospora elynae TaxID=706981 RepID=A0A6A5T0F0_9PLEO|nr:NACHT-domain-containing protein [Clathrospora elynae]